MTRRAAPHRGTDIHDGEGSDEPVAGPAVGPLTSDDGAEAADDEAGAWAGYDRPSKTRLKQQSHDLQKLGVQVAALSEDRLARIEMPESLRDAIMAYRKTRSHEGRRRQMQYVGKLMRSADEAVLREAVAEATLGSARETLLLHETERWRAALIGSDNALTGWMAHYPATDTQQLRSLVRAARRDAAGLAPEARQPKSFRELFTFIKPMLAAGEDFPDPPDDAAP